MVDPAQVIAERFELEHLIGSGGMGDVYRAVDRLTGQAVAVKVLRSPLASDDDRYRFQREVELLSKITHPRVVGYVAHGVTPTNRPYLAMEWLDGEDLSERLGRQPLTMAESTALMLRVAQALGELHARGIVHRDVKPSNLFLIDKNIDDVKILDFGVARVAHAVTAPGRRGTRPGHMVGTPGYMAPEQARGETEVDARVDVFALGCVLFECLTGRPAFLGDQVAALLAKTLLEESTHVHELRPDVPPALDALVARMMSKHPYARPRDAAAVAEELAEFAQVQVETTRKSDTRELRAITGGERRLVSVVIATEVAQPDPAKVPTIANQTVPASYDLRAVAATFGARIEYLLDGCVVTTITGRGNAADQAAHAARCALALREQLPSSPMALATGLAVVQKEGFSGDVIDKAVALLGRARSAREFGADQTAPGESTPIAIHVDETTAGLLDLRFDLGGSDGGLTLRGLREPVTTARTLLGKHASFVGRERELRTLSSLFEECVAEPVARAVLVTAEAGVGKSRLVQEFVEAAQEERATEVLRARGDPMSAGSPFSMLSQAIRHTLGSLDGESVGVRQRRLRARLGRHLDGEVLGRASEFLGELVGAPFDDASSVQLRAARRDPVLMGDQMCRAWEDWLAAECEAQPVLIVLEDLHWGDLPSVNFINSALRNLAESPLMVLAVGRPALNEAFPNLWGERGVQEIRLGPLTKKASEKLVREALAESVTNEQVADLVERAAGNAFYLEELVRAFADGRGHALPETVLAMVEARLERLDPTARRILRAASVFGQVFWKGGVATLLGGSHRAGELDSWLAELANREVITRRSSDEYAFRHGLVRDAAYAMLTREDRTLGHKLAGEWLAPANLAEAVVLAEHFERGGVPDRAAAWFTVAAEQALEGHDFEAAMTRADRAIGCGLTGVEEGKLRQLQADACDWYGDSHEAERYARTALELLPVGSSEWYLAVRDLAKALWKITNREGLVDLAAVLEGAAASAPVTAGRIIGTAHLASRLFYAGDFKLADPLLHEAEAVGRELIERDPSVAGWVNDALALRAMWLNDTEEEIRRTERAVESFEAAGDIRSVCTNRSNLGASLSQLGVVELAETHLVRVIEDADRMGLVNTSLVAKQNLGTVYSRKHRVKDGIRLEQEVAAGFRRVGDTMMEAVARGYLAMMLRLDGQLEAAERESRHGLALMGNVPPLRAGFLGILAAILLDLRSVDEAREAAEEAMQVFQSVGGVVEGESLVRLVHAEALHASGDEEGARAAIAVARDRVIERAERIHNLEWRRSFLERVRENARTLARAGEWLR